jgi:spermidine/putrescine transport system permease protein
MKRLRLLFLTPSALVLTLLYGAPLLIVLIYSFLTRGAYGGVSLPWTVENFTRFAEPLYGRILLRSFLLAAAATGICLLLGFPMALFLSCARRRRNLLLYLVILPFWTSFLVRTYAWLFLLRESGLINSLLLAFGVVSEPLPLLYNHFAVLLGLVHGYLPFMILPLYANLERLDRGLLEAAADLGARPFSTLVRVVVPLCRPGLTAGTVLVFIPSLGAYLTPDLLGGGKSMMIGNLVQNQFTTARDWPFGAAVSLVLMALVLALLSGLRRQREEDFL